jgi:DNA-binding GntR family transcriptional regulator
MPVAIERPIENLSLAERVYQLLKAQIVEGKLAPGEKLDIFALADTLQVSRTPIKEAINRLTLEGLLTIQPQKGTFVSTLEPEKIRQVADIRLMMELWGARRALRNREALNSRRMDEILGRCAVLLAAPEEEFDYSAFAQCNMEFHGLIVEAARNAELSRLYESLEAPVRVTRMFLGRSRQRSRKAHAEHVEMLRALRQGTYAAVKSLLRAHIMGGLNDILKLLEERPGAGAPAR